MTNCLCIVLLVQAQVNQTIDFSSNNKGVFNDYLTHQWNFENGLSIDRIGDAIGILQGLKTISLKN